MDSQTNKLQKSLLPDSMIVYEVHEQDLAYEHGHLSSFKGLKIHGVDYKTLVEILGKPTFPTPNSDQSVYRSWVIRWDSVTYEIYDYNTFDEYFTTHQNTTWWVGSTEGVHTLDLINLIEDIASSLKSDNDGIN